MTENTIITSSATLMVGVLLLVVAFALYFGFKSRRGNQPVFASGMEDKPAQTIPASQVQVFHPDGDFKQIDAVLGEITIDDTQYTTFDTGELYLYDKKNKPVIAIQIDGYGNEQRTINYIKVSEDVTKVDGTIYFVKHNPQDFGLFNEWVNKQMYGGTYSREAWEFKNTMEEIGKFNALLSSGKIRKRMGKYIVSYK